MAAMPNERTKEGAVRPDVALRHMRDLRRSSRRFRLVPARMSKSGTSGNFALQNGEIADRPMSNNGDVKYNGESYFFTYEDTMRLGH
jgi:uncharacterized membrane-anchored protein